MPFASSNIRIPRCGIVSKPLKRVDPELRDIVQRMFELMYEHRGVGLAANQVDLPYRLFITNPKGDPKTGEERVFINPILRASARAGRGRGGLPQHSRSVCPGETGRENRDRRLRSRRPAVSIWNSTACLPASCSMKPTTSTASCSSTA